MGTKHVSQAANQALQSAQRTPAKNSNDVAQSEKRMVHLWERMTHIYLHKWSRTMGESAVDGNNRLTDVAQTWASGLSGLTGDQLARGLHECIDRVTKARAKGDSEYVDHLITLPEFKALCLSKVNNQGLENAAMYRIHSTLALPRPKAEYSKARPFLQTMKAAVNRSTTVSQSLAPQPEVGDETPAAEGREPSGDSFADDSAG